MRTFFLTGVMFAAGCVGGVTEELGVQESASTSSNGRSLNGPTLNGRSLNGVGLDGMTLDGRSLNGVDLSGSELIGTRDDGMPVAGADWVGVTMTGRLSDDSPLPLRIDGASRLAGANADVWTYQVTYALDGGSWAPLCGGPAAIALAGTWNYASGVPGGGSWSAGPEITFACLGNTLAKCVELGYKPWQTVGGTSLRDYHQACTRMLRADYCGDGTSNTFNGWELNVFDNLAIQTPEPGLESWGFEARWSANGARCLSTSRALDLIVSTELPGCVAERVDTACTAGDFADGSQMHNYFDPWGINVALEDAYQRYPLARSDLQSATTAIQQALGYLAQEPPLPVAAGKQVDYAIGKIANAIKKDVPSQFGTDLMRRYALLVRSSLAHEIAKVESIRPNAPGVAKAKGELASGDLALNGTVPDADKAATFYRKGIDAL